MHSCPDPTCEYRTPHSKNLRRHVEKTGHGNTPAKKEFKGHLHRPSNKKKGQNGKGKGRQATAS